MADYLIITGDQAVFQPAFGAATVAVRPGRIAGSGSGSLKGQAVCVVGDEKNVLVPGCVYMTTSHPIPGVGTLKISELAGNQRARKTSFDGRKALLKGGTFKADFQVDTPAQKPLESGGTAPDTTSHYQGRGNFITTNTKYRAT
jgi:hypothetical protein